VISAWLVHAYTASGVVLALLATRAVIDYNYRAAFFWLWLQVVIDATDGALARAARVSERIPWFDGSKLDDVVDYLTYVFVPALFVWVWPPLSAWPYVLGMGVCAMLGHISLVRGYAATDASLAMTFEFSRLPFVVLLGYLAFAETIDAWTWIGALIIFASAIYITRRESRLSVGRS